MDRTNRDELLDTLRAHRATRAERLGVSSLALFGSYARGTAIETSDVDIPVRFDGPATADVFFEVREEPITRLYRRLRVHNPIPSRYDAWDDGSPTRNIPLDHVIGSPAFRSAGNDHMLQLAGFVAHALLLQEEGADTVEDFDLAQAFAALDHALNREASARDPQGVVRR